MGIRSILVITIVLFVIGHYGNDKQTTTAESNANKIKHLMNESDLRGGV